MRACLATSCLLVAVPMGLARRITCWEAMLVTLGKFTSYASVQAASQVAEAQVTELNQTFPAAPRFRDVPPAELHSDKLPL